MNHKRMEILKVKMANMKAAVLHRPIRVLAVFTLFLSVLLYKGPGSALLAQNLGVGINTAGAAPDKSSLLDINASFTGNQGLLIPRMTMAQRNNLATSCACTPAQSLLIFNTTDSCFETYLGTSWRSMWCTTGTCLTPAAPAADTNITSGTQIVWTWSAIEGVTGYQWSTSNTYPGNGVNVVTSPSYTQTGISGGPHSLYVWAYNACGFSNPPTNLIQSITPPACGGQVWASSNLTLRPYSTYTVSEAVNNPQPAGKEWCYNDDTTNCTTYGGLFDWNNATGLAVGAGIGDTCNPCGSGGVKGLCPSGYHIPTDQEWSQYEYCIENNISPVGSTALSTFQTTVGFRGSISATGGIDQGAGAKLKMTTAEGGNWADGVASNDISGFAGLAGGNIGSGGPPAHLGAFGDYWTATEYNGSPVSAWNHYLQGGHPQSARTRTNEPIGYSVRCLKN
jgi:uncharacterized protein (TIGR02145 family)